MAHSNLLETIPTKDWEATPASVQNLLLSLLPLAEAAEQRKRSLQNGDIASSVPFEKHSLREQEVQKSRLHRYHLLVDKSFLSGLSEHEEAEKRQLGQEIDKYNAVFYEPVIKVIETIEAKRKEANGGAFHSDGSCP